MNNPALNARLIAVNVGTPQQIAVNNRTVLTSIIKTAVQGKVVVRTNNLEGDKQADLRVHGGPYKAIYSYPSEHYDSWKAELELEQLPWGAFGENLTTEGITEETLMIGDQFRIGSAILQVAQPRMPCFKLAIRFERADMIKRFWASNRSGTYFSVVAEGELEAGSPIQKIAEGPGQVSVADVVRLYKGEEWSHSLRTRALDSPLRGSWKEKIRERLTESV